MYPLENYFSLRRTYRHGDKTFYSPHHFGVDIIVPTGTQIIAWDDVKIINRLAGSQGGLTIWIEWKGYIFRFLHLSEQGKVGKYEKGNRIAKSGNTGASTAPHVHIDAWSVKTGVTLRFEDCLDPDELFKKLIIEEESMIKEFVNAVEDITGNEYGDTLNEKEQVDAAKKLQDRKHALEMMAQLELANKRLMENNGELSVKLGLATTEADNLRLELEKAKAVAEGNAEQTKAWDGFVFFVKTIIKSVK